MCEKTAQDTVELKMMEQNLERDRVDLEEQKKVNAFLAEERAYMRRQWAQDTENQKQEVTRRAIETCVSVLRGSTAVVQDKDISTEAKQAATAKLQELIPKLG